MKKIFITMLALLSMATAQAQTQGVYARFFVSPRETYSLYAPLSAKKMLK